MKSDVNNQGTAPPSKRKLIRNVAILLVLAQVGSWQFNRTTPRVHADSTAPRLYVDQARQFRTSYKGSVRAMGTMSARQAQALSLASVDFDADGINDLAIGFAAPGGGGLLSIHRGNLDAFAPQSDASFQAIARSEFPSPFLAEAELVEIPGRPDFMASGDFIGHDGPAVMAATRGGHSVYVLARGASGKVELLQTVDVPGAITALGTRQISGKYWHAVIGVHGPNGAQAMLFSGSNEGLAEVSRFSLSGDATAVDFGDLDGDGITDALLVAGGKLSVLHFGSNTIDQIQVPFTVAGAVLGRFVFDRDPVMQMSLLASDGSVHIMVEDNIDSTPITADEARARRAALYDDHAVRPRRSQRNVVWKELESYSGTGAFDGAGRAPLMLHTRISNNAADDVMLLNSSRMSVLAHRDLNPSSGVVITRADLAADAVTALAVRVNVDPRPGILFMKRGETVPHIMMPLPDPTFTVNTTADGVHPGACAAATAGQCTLREAILEANGDTIMVPAGTYTLTLPRVNGDYTGNHGGLYVNHTATIVGAGQGTTFIEAGTIGFGQGVQNGVDLVMAVNEDIGTITNASATISNLTIRNGFNRGTHGNDGDGGCMEFDTGSSGTATLSLTNVTLANCKTSQGNGGGIASFNFTVPGTGAVTLSGVTIQNNQADDTIAAGGVAGGFWVSSESILTMTNSQILNNVATKNGGGISFNFSSPSKGPTAIHSSTISGNSATLEGGGLNITGDVISATIDQNSVISNNTAGGTNFPGVGNVGGGGLLINLVTAVGNSLAISNVTISGNTATNSRGGGIANGSDSGADGFSIHFSRLAGNTATPTTSNNLWNDNTPVAGTNNWWGTNAPFTTIDDIHGGVTTYDPFVVLTNKSNPTKIRINQTTPLTADMSKDSHGNAVGLGNLARIIGLPISFGSPVLGTLSGSGTTIDANAQAASTFNAGGTSGNGFATATVDQAPVLVNSYAIRSATESGTTATITTAGAHNFAAGDRVVIANAQISGYNGTFLVISAPTSTTFTYTAGTSGLGAATPGGTATEGIIILEPPSITKSFSPTTVAENVASTVTFGIGNNNIVGINGSFTDNLPANLVVATPPSVTNTCGAGTATANAGATSISYASTPTLLLPVGGCTITVHVSSAVDNVYHNTVQILSTDAGNGNTASTNPDLTVINPPTIAKAFGAATIPLNGSTSLTFTLTSTNTNLSLSGVAFTDNLPSGLVVATPNNLSSTCSGTATAVAGSSSASLAGAGLAPGASCTVSLNVTGTTAGVKNNSVQATSTEAGNGNTSNASITVVAPPVIIKAFGAASVPLNGSTSLTFTIQNNNTTVALSGIGFADTLPAGLVVATPNGLTGSCGGGTITAVAGSGSLSLTGATVAQSASCTFAINVTGITAGTQNNTTGNVTSTEGGTGGTASASINVVAPPTFAKAFGATVIPVNGTTSLTFTITNPSANAVAETGVAFSDTLPAGLVVATPNGLSNACGGTATAVAGSSSISLTGGTLGAPPNSCTLVINVTGTTSGLKNNTTGTISSTNGGTGLTASASITVAAAPTITKAFGVATISLNGSTSLTFTITNPNTGVDLTGLAFTDNLPSGLVVATPNGLTSTCNGTATAVAGSGSASLSAGTVVASGNCQIVINVTGTTSGVKNNSVQVTSTEGGTGNTSNASITVAAPPVIIKAFGAASIPLNGSTSLTFTIQNNNTTTTLTGVGYSDTLPSGLVVATPNGLTGSCGGGTITATAGSGSVSLSGATLTQSTSCTFAINVTGTTAGTQNNTTGNVTSTEGGTGGTASASINVVAPPTFTKAFGASNVPLNGTTSLTFTITNPAANAVAENGIAFTDTLPAGLVVATPNGLTNNCGGTVTAVAGSGSISLTGGTIATPGNSCTVVVNVTATTSGVKNNTTGAITSTNGGTGTTASASLTVATALTITKAFGAASVPLNGTTSLTFTITNPNAGLGVTGVAFTDNLPSGLVVATPNGLTNTCNGTPAAVSTSGVVSLSAGTIAANGSCTVAVNVTGTTAGVKNNSVQVSSTEGGTGNTSNASITVVAPPVIIKAFGAASIPLNGSTSLTFTIQNNNTTTTLTGVGYGDTLPSGLVVATPNGLTGSCGGGTITATAGSGSVSLSGATLAPSTSCTFAINVTGTTAGTKNNTTGNVTSTEGGTGGTASASINVVAPPSIAKAFGAVTVGIGGVTSLTFTITNPGANAVAETGVAFTDTLPAGMIVATPNGLTNTCGGTATATAGSNSISLTGGTIAASSSCTLVANVTVTAGGTYNNVSGNVSSTNGGTGNTASASLTSGGSIGGSIGLKSGPLNARIWPIIIGNNGPGIAAGAQVSSVLLQQTFGGACTPVVQALPVVAGDIPAAATATANVTIDFSSCTGTVAFKATIGLSANSGAITGTIVRTNQLP
jgi:CSLREA domain-containing protein/uncharacterized repeat protein (TIGR01451 family)